MATTLYLRADTSEAGASGFDHLAESGSMSAIGPSNQPLLSLLPDPQPNPFVSALAAQDALQSVSQQRLMLVKFVSVPLGVSDIPAGSWSWAFAGYVGSAMNAFFDPVVYVKKQSTGAITGRVFDNDANVGTEVATSGHTKGRTGSFTGLHVPGITIGDDRLVLEVWIRVFPAAVPLADTTVATGYDGATPITNGPRVDMPMAFITAPVDGLILATISDSIASTGHGATSFSEASVVPQVSIPSAGHGATSITATIGDLINVESAGHGITTITAFVQGAGGGVQVDDLSEQCWGGAQPWLQFNGIEIANLARMRSYAMRLAPEIVRWGCAPNDVLYRTSGAHDYFVSPQEDPASWWDPAYPESADFLGVCLEPAIDVPFDRQNTALLRRGAALGPLRMKERTLTATGFLLATTHRGLEYGKRWLLSQTSGCTDCTHGADLDLYLSSPPVDGSRDDVGRWQLRRTGIQSVDVSDPMTPFADCTVVFTLGDPLLYKTPTEVLPFETLPYVNVPISTGQWEGPHDCISFADWFCGVPAPSAVAPVDPPPFGELATVLTIDATAEAINGLVIEVLADCNDPESVLASATIGSLERGSVFVMDSAREQVTYYRADGTIEDGARQLVIPDGVAMPWVVVSHCDAARCLAIRRARYCSLGLETQVQIQTVLRAE